MRPRRRIEAPALLLLLAASEGTSHAGAPNLPTVEVLVIHATRTDAGSSMDPQLSDVARHAREQPFLRFNTFKLLERKQIPIEAGKSVTDALVNGRTVQLTLLDVIEQGGQKRFHLRAGIDDPGKQALLKVLEVTAGANEPFFVAGPAFRGGTLFLEFVVRP